MKLINTLYGLIVALLITMIVIAGQTVVDLTEEYPTTPYDRCMASFEGSVNESECKLLEVLK